MVIVNWIRVGYSILEKLIRFFFSGLWNRDLEIVVVGFCGRLEYKRLKEEVVRRLYFVTGIREEEKSIYRRERRKEK